MARQEGVEPPTYGLEGRCSIQLSYCRFLVEHRAGVTQKPMSAIWRPSYAVQGNIILVGARGFEPPTSCSQSKRATGLRYAPRRPDSTEPVLQGQIPSRIPSRILPNRAE